MNECRFASWDCSCLLACEQGDHHSRTLAHHSRTEKNSQDMFFLGGIVIFIRYNGTSF
jgi:hypothetical protein